MLTPKLVREYGRSRASRGHSMLDDIVMSKALQGHGLHPSLSPLLPFVENGRMATLAGIGFDDPNRSHFVSMDRWARADRLDDSLGWLGRWLDTLPDELTSLGATSLGAVGEVAIGASKSATVIDDVDDE